MYYLTDFIRFCCSVQDVLKTLEEKRKAKSSIYYERKKHLLVRKYYFNEELHAYLPRKSLIFDQCHQRLLFNCKCQNFSSYYIVGAVFGCVINYANMLLVYDVTCLATYIYVVLVYTIYVAVVFPSAVAMYITKFANSIK